MSILHNVSTIISAASTNLGYDKVKSITKNIAGNYVPDCALIASGVMQENKQNGSYAFTAPWRGDTGSTGYYEFFEIIAEDPTQSHYIAKFKSFGMATKNIITYASLPGVDILHTTPGKRAKITAGDNFDAYMKWATAAVNMWNHVMKLFDVGKEIDFNKIEKTYMSGLTNYGKSVHERILNLKPEINAAVNAMEKIKSTVVDEKPYDSVKNIVKHVKFALTDAEFKENIKKYTSYSDKPKVDMMLFKLIKNVSTKLGYNFSDAILTNIKNLAFDIVATKKEDGFMIKPIKISAMNDIDIFNAVF